VLAETLTVDLDEADHGLRAYATMTATSVHRVAQQIVDGELILSRKLCVPEQASSPADQPSAGRDLADR
jgi:hypothetical protein